MCTLQVAIAGFLKEDPNLFALHVLDVNLDHLALPFSPVLSPSGEVITPARPPSPAWRPRPINQNLVSTSGKSVKMVSFQDRSSFLLVQHDKLFTYDAENEVLRMRGVDLEEGRSGPAVLTWEDEDGVFDCAA